MKSIGFIIAVMLICSACKRASRYEFSYVGPEQQGLYGQLYLQKGQWEGKQIVPADWIEVSTYPWSVYNPEYGLARGMLWGVILADEEGEGNSFYHTGAGIHMLGVYPASGLVLVHRVDTENDFDYQRDDLYRMIELVFDAKTE